MLQKRKFSPQLMCFVFYLVDLVFSMDAFNKIDSRMNFILQVFCKKKFKQENVKIDIFLGEFT